ncbi:MAG: ribbon-helix-helix domain-containing protein [Thermomicrobiales bacterium]
MASKTARTTLTLPADLLEQIDRRVANGGVRSRNSYVIIALQRQLEADEDAAIDADLAGMADDEAYLAEAREIADEFVLADWEALRLGESSQ